MSEDKKVDETWKDNVAKQKESDDQTAETQTGADTGFAFFATSLGLQAFYMLGEFPDEKGERPAADLKQAKYLIDILQMLAEKTKGNLTPEEDTTLKTLLYELEMKFVQKSQTVT